MLYIIMIWYYYKINYVWTTICAQQMYLHVVIVLIAAPIGLTNNVLYFWYARMSVKFLYIKFIFYEGYQKLCFTLFTQGWSVEIHKKKSHFSLSGYIWNETIMAKWADRCVPGCVLGWFKPSSVVFQTLC